MQGSCSRATHSAGSKIWGVEDSSGLHEATSYLIVSSAYRKHPESSDRTKGDVHVSKGAVRLLLPESKVSNRMTWAM